MANPFEDDMDDQPPVAIKEGLLCPVCLQDFRQISQLQDHFLSAHSAERKEPENIGSQIKGFIGKAKKKILQDDEVAAGNGDTDEVAVIKVASSPRPSQYYVPWRQSQEPGQSRRHFDYFKQIREDRVERYVIETNKLLIRLDKLITDAPADVNKRKLHEKNIVSWVSDADVKLCPSCAKTFNLGRRRHHCRLCGAIMCHNCSQFLEFEYAKKLISPTNLEAEAESSSLSLPVSGTLNRASGSRRGSTSSLMSVMNQSTGEQHVRVCYDCKVLLDKRNKLILNQRARPTLCHFYERLKSTMDDAERLVPVYTKMCYSFTLGETTYNLNDAQDLRFKLMKQAELIDQLSRKIANLGMDSFPPPEDMQLKLQAKLRLAATQFLKEHMIGLPSTPSQDEFVKAQEQRQLEIDRKVQNEKKRALDDQNRKQQSTSTGRPNLNGLTSPNSNSSSFELVSPETGWGAESSGLRPESSVSQETDPMLLQINQVKAYIKQARLQHRYDEVSMLESNLKELEIEYMLSKQDLS
ncbi:Rabenosyn-5 [Halotydeus destructor]|nr:Rabenosyn-5 [Halotydeus destructor]